MIRAWFVRWQIQRAINAAWRNPAGSATRQELFPDGKPTVEQFIRTVAEQVKQQSDDTSTSR